MTKNESKEHPFMRMKKRELLAIIMKYEQQITALREALLFELMKDDDRFDLQFDDNIEIQLVDPSARGTGTSLEGYE